jgi:hypothetical protein
MCQLPRRNRRYAAGPCKRRPCAENIAADPIASIVTSSKDAPQDVGEHRFAVVEVVEAAVPVERLEERAGLRGG